MATPLMQIDAERRSGTLALLRRFGRRKRDDLSPPGAAPRQEAIRP